MPTNSSSELETECRRLAEALALAERDRQLLGYEIHDGLVQSLTAAAMLLEGAGRNATFVSPENDKNYASGVRLLQEGIAKARRLIQNAAGVEKNELGLATSLSQLVDKFQINHGLPVTFTCDIPDPKLPGSIQH